MEDMIQSTELTTEKKQDMQNMLLDFIPTFPPPSGPKRLTDVTSHEIDNGLKPQIKLRFLSFPQVQHEQPSGKIRKMLDRDITEPGDIPWAARVELVEKKDGSMRFCIDYRKLNNITRKDFYPLPYIKDISAAMAGVKYFCPLNLASGYWQPLIGCKTKDSFCHPRWTVPG